MNFLAHAVLSFNNEALLVGNMISDFVKGKKQYEYVPEIHNGIRLHRMIDTFTDDHPVTRQAKLFLKHAVGLYSGAFIDVVYDHFLANDPLQFDDKSLAIFAGETYNILEQNHSVLPVNFQAMLPYMRSQNWLYNYKTLAGTQHSFAGITRRARYLQSSDEAFKAFEKHYTSLQKCYSEFFPELKQFAAQQLLTVNQS